LQGEAKRLCYNPSMTLTTDDKRFFRGLLDEKLDERLEPIKEDIKAMKGEIGEIKETMATKDDLAKIRDEMATKKDLQQTEQRITAEINSTAKSTVKYIISHDKRIERLEDHAGLPPLN